MLRPKEVVSKWVDAFNNHDVEEITSLYHEDATNHQVANEPVIGIEAIRSMFTNEFSIADMTCIVENTFEDGQWAGCLGSPASHTQNPYYNINEGQGPERWLCPS